jgi:iron complex outermembrane recepter protein
MKSLFLGASLLVLCAPAVLAQTVASLDEVVVTGTHESGVRAADSAAPVEIVTAPILAHAGYPGLMAGLGATLPAFNVEPLANDTAELTLAAALRGLSANDTLVLVNGKRRHTTANLAVDGGAPYTGAAAADLSFIPVAAIDHVEVLLDGASAQYGSDAVAGVVNIILKSSDHGGEATALGGAYGAGDGATGSWSVNKGFSLGPRGFLNVTVEERYHGFSQRGACDARFYDTQCRLAPGLDPVDAAGIPNAPGAPDVNRVFGDAQYNLYNAALNAGYDLGGVQAYAFATLGHREAQAFENYRPPSKITNLAGTEFPFPDGFDPRERLQELDYSVTAGLKGTVAGWRWDLSTTYGRDHDAISTLGSANLSLFQATGATPTNFYDGAFSSSEWTTNLDLDRSFGVGLASPLNVAMGLEARRDAYGIGAGDAASSFGAGAQGFPGFVAVDAGTHSRTNFAAYVDLAANPVRALHVDLAGRYEHYSDFGDALVGELTGRYDLTPAFALRGTASTGFRAPTLAEEYYSATSVSPQFASVQLPANSAAAAQAGFAPLRSEQSYNLSLGFVAHPAPRLQITADAYEIDVLHRIVDTGFLLGSICSQPTNGACPAGQLLQVSQGVNRAIAAHGATIDTGLSYTGINIFANGANTRTRGVEATADYASDFGDAGTVTWSLGFDFNTTMLTRAYALPATAQNAAFGQTQVLSPTALSALTTATPKEKAILTALWRRGPWDATLRETIYGPSSEILSANGTGEAIPGPAYQLVIRTAAITDLEIGRELGARVRVAAGANNLFDHRPPPFPAALAGTPGAGDVRDAPAGFSPYGIDGGFYYGRVTYSF